MLKRVAPTSAMADALRNRGVPDLAVSIAAEVGALTFKIVFDRRVSEPNTQDLSRLLRASLDQLKGIVAGT